MKNHCAIEHWKFNDIIGFVTKYSDRWAIDWMKNCHNFIKSRNRGRKIWKTEKKSFLSREKLFSAFILKLFQSRSERLRHVCQSEFNLFIVHDMIILKSLWTTWKSSHFLCCQNTKLLFNDWHCTWLVMLIFPSRFPLIHQILIFDVKRAENCLQNRFYVQEFVLVFPESASTRWIRANCNKAINLFIPCLSLGRQMLS